jgi:fucose permease
MFLFCGIENAVAGWAASLALPSFSNAYTATSANIAFWASFLASRALAPLILRYVSEPKLLLLSIGTGAIGVLVFSFAFQPAAILLACALAGFGIGPGFPLLIARISELIGSQHPASTVCFAFAGLGAASLPTLSGIVGAGVHHPRVGLIVPFLGLLLLIPLSRALPGSDPHTSDKSSDLAVF